MLADIPKAIGLYIVTIDLGVGRLYGRTKGLTGDGWILTIRPSPVPDLRTPSPDAVVYGTWLYQINLENGWKWTNGDILPKVGTYEYDVYYEVEDWINYDWSGVDGYNPKTHRVERKAKLRVFVDKSGWGEERTTTIPDGSTITSYYDEKTSTTSAEVTNYGMIWQQVVHNKGDKLFGIDNSEGIFEDGSRFWVRLLQKEKEPEEWGEYYEILDDKYKSTADENRLYIFITGVTYPDGVTPYEKLDKSLTYYAELGEDWDEDITALYFGEDDKEEITVEYIHGDPTLPIGKRFAKLIFTHFSPYALYNKALYEIENSSPEEEPTENAQENDELDEKPAMSSNIRPPLFPGWAYFPRKIGETFIRIDGEKIWTYDLIILAFSILINKKSRKLRKYQ